MVLQRCVRVGMIVVLCLGMTAVAGGEALAAPVEAASVAPIAPDAGGGYTVGEAVQNLPALGYTEKEFSLSGNAATYTQAGPWASDGRWPVSVSGSSPYTTRMIVRRPEDPAAFNGTVIVEWLNVSFTVDIDVDWSQSWSQFTRAGYAYVGVTSQKVGTDFLTRFDPKRYAGMSIPSDDASYDIFSQAGAAVRAGSGDLLSGLEAKRVLATGHSQSAGRLVTYANAIQPTERVFDGILIHGRGATAAGLNGSQGSPTPTRIRPDLGAPVLQLQSQTDVPLFSSARQADTPDLRTWEVAGTAHADAYGLVQYNAQNAVTRAVNDGAPITCLTPVNSAPFRYASNLAYADLDRWVATGTQPPSFPPLETGLLGLPVTDQAGNAKGGLRLPDLDVPIATYSGAGLGGQGLLGIGACLLLGRTTPLPAATLKQLYPDHAAYVEKYTAAARSARDNGALLPADYELAVAAAAAAPIPTAP